MEVGLKIALAFQKYDSFVGHFSENLERIEIIVDNLDVDFDEAVLFEGVVHLFSVPIFDDANDDVLLKAVIREYNHISKHESS